MEVLQNEERLQSESIIEDDQGLRSEKTEEINSPEEEPVESGAVDDSAVEQSLSIDISDDTTLYDVLNAKRSPKQNCTTSKRILRKSTIMLAGISKDLLDESNGIAPENTDIPKMEEEEKKKKKSFKNLFGLLSFGGKSKANSDQSTKVSAPNITTDPGDGNSTDETSQSLSVDSGVMIATDHVTNPIKALDSPGKVDTTASSPAKTDDSIPSHNISSSPAIRRASLSRIRSKSIHRVVSVRLSDSGENNNQQVIADTPSVRPTIDSVQQDTTTVDVSVTPVTPTTGISSAFQLFPTIDDQSPEMNQKEPQESVSTHTSNYPAVEEPMPVMIQTPDGRRLSIKILSAGAPIVPPPPSTISNEMLSADNTVEEHPVMKEGEEGEGLQLGRSIESEEITAEQPAEEEVDGVTESEEDFRKEANEPEENLPKSPDDYVAEEEPVPVMIQTPDGRRLSIKILSAGAPIVPPPPLAASPSIVEVEVREAMVETGDGRRLSIKALTPGAPIVPPPPLPSSVSPASGIATSTTNDELPEISYTEQDYDNEQVLTEDTDNDNDAALSEPANESFVRTVPPPPPPPAVYTGTTTLSESESLSDSPEEIIPVSIIQTPDGRRLSIKALTHGAPVPPPPPAM